ncbi:MAG: hypothetical protein HKN47_17205 [Pirellulaceae bacterium]|nr:hypothetical protein [Pirellulaceae bacterium]
MRLPIRFSLRLLMLIVSGSALAFAYEARREAQRRHLVEAIEHDGGEVNFDDATWPSPFPTRRISSVTIPYLSMDRFTDEQLSSLTSLKEIIIPDVQCPCPGEVSKRKASCLVPYVVEIRLSVSPGAKELLNKIRGRQDRLTPSEVKRSYREEVKAREN